MINIKFSTSISYCSNTADFIKKYFPFYHEADDEIFFYKALSRVPLVGEEIRINKEEFKTFKVESVMHEFGQDYAATVYIR